MSCPREVAPEAAPEASSCPPAPFASAAGFGAQNWLHLLKKGFVQRDAVPDSVQHEVQHEVEQAEDASRPAGQSDQQEPSWAIKGVS